MEIVKISIEKGFSEDDIIIAIRHLKLPKKYRVLKEVDYIEGQDEELEMDGEDYIDEEVEELADYYIAKGYDEEQVRLSLAKAKYKDEIVEMLLTIQQYFRNGMLILEEANSYFRHRVPDEFYISGDKGVCFRNT